MRMNPSGTRLLVLLIALTGALCAPGCEKKTAGKQPQQPQVQNQTQQLLRPLINPPLKWVDLLTPEINQWDIKGREAVNAKCGNLAGTSAAGLFQACLQEKVPEDLRQRTWNIALYTGPSTTSAQIGELRITGKVLGGFTLQFVAKDAAAIAFEPDDSLAHSETETLNHTVLEQRENWVLLPRSPFPSEVWMDAAQHAVHGAEDSTNTVYKWNGQGIVILEKQETGVRARQEIPTDFDCEGDAKPTPESQIKKFSIPWTELFDENHHLRLKQKYTIC